MTGGIVVELQKDCLDESKSVNSMLRKARLIAAKLELNDLSEWIDHETNGYRCAPDDLPGHRKGAGQPKFFNPYNGWCPIQTGDDWIGEHLHTAYFFQPVAELEHMLQSDGSTLIMTLMSPIEELVQKQLPAPMQVGLHFNKAQIFKALDFVRNKTLDWTVQLEAMGITGEGMTFGQDAKKAAQNITNNIYGGNVGVLGSVSGNAENSGFVSISGPVNAKRIEIFTDKIRGSVAGLPEDVQSEIRDLLERLDNQKKVEPPNESLISNTLDSMKAILLGAGGNLTAEAMLAAIAGF